MNTKLFKERFKGKSSLVSRDGMISIRPENYIQKVDEPKKLSSSKRTYKSHSPAPEAYRKMQLFQNLPEIVYLKQTQHIKTPESIKKHSKTPAFGEEKQFIKFKRNRIAIIRSQIDIGAKKARFESEQKRSDDLRIDYLQLGKYVTGQIIGLKASPSSILIRKKSIF